jgi:hypothetical protein
MITARENYKKRTKPLINDAVFYYQELKMTRQSKNYNIRTEHLISDTTVNGQSVLQIYGCLLALDSDSISCHVAGVI